MIKKVVSSILGVLMLGNVTVVSLSEECLKYGENEEETVFLPEVALEWEFDKACFEEEQDYQVFKEAVFKRWHDNGNSVKVWDVGYFSPEFNAADEFLMVINEEAERGNIVVTDDTTYDQAVDQLVNSYNFAYFPDPLFNEKGQ